MAHAQLASNPSVEIYRDPRVSYWLQPGEELVQCPYEKSHWILTRKMIFHLTKCRHNYENDVKSGKRVVSEEEEMVVCPFNTLHHMPRKELEQHTEECAFNERNKEENRRKLVLEEMEREKESHAGEKPAKFQVIYPDPRRVNLGGAPPLATGFGRGKPIFEGAEVVAEGWKACGLERGRRSGEQINEVQIGGAMAELKRELTPEEIKENERISQEMRELERFATPDQATNPEYNWELELDQNDDAPRKKFMSYDPEEHMKLNRHHMITNPQGLTRSERRAYHAEMRSLRMMEERQEEERLEALANPPDDIDEPPVPGRRDLTKRLQRKTIARPGFPGYELALDMEVRLQIQEHQNNNDVEGEKEVEGEVRDQEEKK